MQRSSRGRQPAGQRKGYTGVVQDFRRKLNASQRANMIALHWLAQNSGMKITVTDKVRSYLNPNSKLSDDAGLNGFFRRGRNEAIIDMRAMKNANIITVFHEAWHFVEQEAKAEAALAYNGTGAIVLGDVNWLAALSAGRLGFVTAWLLALTGLPEAEE